MAMTPDIATPEPGRFTFARWVISVSFGGTIADFAKWLPDAWGAWRLLALLAFAIGGTWYALFVFREQRSWRGADAALSPPSKIAGEG